MQQSVWKQKNEANEALLTIEISKKETDLQKQIPF